MSTDSAILADYLTLEADLTAGPLATPTYAPIDATLIAGSVTRGRFSIGADDVASPGTATFLIDNTTAVLDIDTWYRGKHIRLSTVGGVRIFTGFIDRVRHDHTQSPWRSFATIECVDRRTYHQRGTLTELGFTVPSDGRFTPPGFNVPWIPPDFGADEAITYDLAELHREWADNELGEYRVAADGTATLLDRWWRLRVGETTGISADFSDDDANLAAGSFPLLAQQAGGTLEWAEPEETYRDRIEFTGLSGVLQIAENVPADYDPVVMARTTRCPDDPWMQANCDYLLPVYAATRGYWRRFTARAMPSTIAETLAAVDLGHLVLIIATPVGHSQQTQSLFVESITHSFSQDSATWDITFGVSPLEPWDLAWGVFSDYLKLDDATTGLLNTGKAAP